jgi:hypothetical protein
MPTKKRSKKQLNLANGNDIHSKCDLREDGGRNTIHPVRVGEGHQTSVEDVLSRVDQKKQGLRKELTEKIDETQVNLETIRMSVDTQTKNLLETITDTTERLHETLGLLTQVETQINKSLIDTM